MAGVEHFFYPKFMSSYLEMCAALFLFRLPFIVRLRRRPRGFISRRKENRCYLLLSVFWNFRQERHWCRWSIHQSCTTNERSKSWLGSKSFHKGPTKILTAKHVFKGEKVQGETAGFEAERNAVKCPETETEKYVTRVYMWSRKSWRHWYLEDLYPDNNQKVIPVMTREYVLTWYCCMNTQ